MIYLYLKFFHIVSSTVLFGTGIGTAAVMLYGHLTKKISTIAAINQYVVLADWLFTATSGVIQLLTGLGLVWLGGYSFSLFWVWSALLGYTIAGACWVPVVFLQIKMRDLAIKASRTQSTLPALYYTYFKIWFLLGWPAFISLLGVFYVMTAKPT